MLLAVANPLPRRTDRASLELAAPRPIDRSRRAASGWRNGLLVDLEIERTSGEPFEGLGCASDRY